MMFEDLERNLAEITGLHYVSLQPNAGAQGEYAGLLVIRAYHDSRGDQARDVCLIPQSAHGTNPASAVMAGLRVVVVATDDPRIAEAVASFGGEAMMTSPDHPSGSDRVAEVARSAEGRRFDVIVNFQADEPFLPPAHAGAAIVTAIVTRRRPVASSTESSTRASTYQLETLITTIVSARPGGRYSTTTCSRRAMKPRRISRNRAVEYWERWTRTLRGNCARSC